MRHRGIEAETGRSWYVVAMRTILFFVFLASLVQFGCAAPDTTVVLVRHAERGAGRDPDLTPEGRARAEALVEVARRERVEAIYVTPFKRTRQTAEPTATALGLTPIVTPLSASVEAHAAAVAADIRAKWTGKSVLVVGHSNTVPLVMKELGVEAPPVIEESEYGRAFVVKIAEDGTVRVEEAAYGEGN